MPNSPQNFQTNQGFPFVIKDVLDGGATKKYLVGNIQGDKVTVPKIKNIFVSISPDIPYSDFFHCARLLITTGIGQINDLMPLNDGAGTSFGNYLNPARLDQPSILSKAQTLFECQLEDKYTPIVFDEPLACSSDDFTNIILTWGYGTADTEASAPAVSSICIVSVNGWYQPIGKTNAFELGV